MFDWFAQLASRVAVPYVQLAENFRQNLLNTTEAFLEFFKLETFAPIFLESFGNILVFISGLGGESFSNSIDDAFTGYAEPIIVTGFGLGAYYIDWFIPWDYFSSVIAFSMAATAAAFTTRGALWIYLKIWGSN